MDWHESLAGKLVSPREAVRAVKPGDQVTVAPFTCTPFTLCEALYERRNELRDVRIDHHASLFRWVREGEDSGPSAPLRPGSPALGGLGGSGDRTGFEVHTCYATPLDRDGVNAGRVEFLPTARWRADEVPPGWTQEPDVYLVPVSPPDGRGYCSFGPGVWFSPTFCQRAKTVIAEVHESFIRTGGKNFVHASQIDYWTEAQQPTGGAPVPPRTEEETAVTEVICALAASELINDRDTIQVGIGTVSSAIALYLHEKHELGMQTEMVPGGTVDLVDEGVLTGRYKTLHQGKVVGSVLVAMPPEEMARIDGHPAFELHEFGYCDDVRLLAQQDNLVATNNALFVDLTGQVASETIGPRVWTGVGGQTAFAMAAQYSRGGRSITMLPSSHLLNGERVTRIVPVLPQGTAVTIPRTFVDHVVTEHGIATLHGKTVRERIGELIGVAHPDFRGELKTEARRLYGVAV